MKGQKCQENKTDPIQIKKQINKERCNDVRSVVSFHKQENRLSVSSVVTCSVFFYPYLHPFFYRLVHCSIRAVSKMPPQYGLHILRRVKACHIRKKLMKFGCGFFPSKYFFERQVPEAGQTWTVVLAGSTEVGKLAVAAGAVAIDVKRK